MKNANGTTGMYGLLFAAVCGALCAVGVCIGLSFFPNIGSVPIPTGGGGRLDFGQLGMTPLPYAAIGGALFGGWFWFLSARDE